MRILVALLVSVVIASANPLIFLSGSPPAAGGAAITVSVLTSGQISPSGTTVTTPSVLPGANRLLIAVIACRFNGAVSDDVISVAGNGLTWNRISERQQAAGFNRMIGVYYSMGASPSSGVITFTESEGDAFQGQAAVMILEFSNVNTTGTNGSGAIDIASLDDSAPASGTSVSLNLTGTPGAGDVTFGVMSIADNASSIVSDSNVETIGSVAPGDEVQMRADWDVGQDTAITWTWTTSVGSAAVGFIINAP